MPLKPPQLVQLNCPNCQQAFRTDLYTLVDVQQQPEAKQALLAGRLNVAVCPACNAATMIAAPLVYHDAEKQLCFVSLPQELNMGTAEQERMIGDYTSSILSDLPPESPRGYLLTPRRFISLQSLMDAILEADGIPREVVEAQRNRIDLISRLVEALPNDEQFGRLVQQYRNDLSDEFLMMVNTFIEASVQEQQYESAHLLTLLRDKLTQHMGLEGEGNDKHLNLDELIEKLANATDEELEEHIAEMRPYIDYAFFQALTSRIEAHEQAGQTDEAQRLTACRSRILEMVERVDQEAQSLFEDATHLLHEVLNADDPREVLAENTSRINEAFMMLLSASIESAEREGQHELVAALEQIGIAAVGIIQESLPADERFINDLLLAGSPQESSKLLRQNAANVTTDFVKKLNELADEQEQRGGKDRALLLRQLAREASAMLF